MKIHVDVTVKGAFFGWFKPKREERHFNVLAGTLITEVKCQPSPQGGCAYVVVNYEGPGGKHGVKHVEFEGRKVSDFLSFHVWRAEEGEDIF